MVPNTCRACFENIAPPSRDATAAGSATLFIIKQWIDGKHDHPKRRATPGGIGQPRASRPRLAPKQLRSAP